jgi:hypothetical protein
MLALPRWFIRCALLYMLLGAGLGLYLLLCKAWTLGTFDRSLITVHNHLITVGGFLFMICGVSMWMFPRPQGISSRQAQRDPLGWAAFWLLNLGLVLRALTEPFASPGTWPGRLLGAAGICLVLGLLCYALALRRRILGPRLTGG